MKERVPTPLMCLSGVNSNPKCNTQASTEHFRWRPIGETFPGSIIEGPDYVGKLCGTDPREVGGFGNVIAQQPIGVLIRPPAPTRHTAWQSTRGGVRRVAVQGTRPIRSRYRR